MKTKKRKRIANLKKSEYETDLLQSNTRSQMNQSFICICIFFFELFFNLIVIAKNNSIG